MNPPWTHEPVTVLPPDPGWQAAGRSEVERLASRLGRWLVADLEHVGSTSVPGLAAKPILDVLGTVADLDCAEAVERALATEGWVWVRPGVDDEPRRLFVKVVDGHRAAHLHLMLPANPAWTLMIRFRDRLRAEPALRDAYAALKRDLAARHRDDREAYTEAKTAFIVAASSPEDPSGPS
jgi:GrpB-like predicted nucleotidyltransferase (UPF0157 family)